VYWHCPWMSVGIRNLADALDRALRPARCCCCRLKGGTDEDEQPKFGSTVAKGDLATADKWPATPGGSTESL
jgi:hypothetical protein